MKTFVLSEGIRENTLGFRVDVAGIKLDRFRENPVMLYAHKSDAVIGRWENIRLDGGRLLADADFDLDDATGKEIARKVEKGFLRGCSAGIRITELTAGDDCPVASRSELLEASICPVPSDAGAVLLYDAGGQVTDFKTVGANLAFQFNNNNMDKVTVTELAAQVTDLSAQLATRDTRIADLEAKLRESEKQGIKRLVDGAIAEKKIGADERETYTALAEKDYASVEKILSKMRGVQPVSGQLNTQGIASKFAGKSWDELDRAGLLVALKAEAPELYTELFNVKFAK